jgi:hypothetical protein
VGEDWQEGLSPHHVVTFFIFSKCWYQRKIKNSTNGNGKLYFETPCSVSFLYEAETTRSVPRKSTCRSVHQECKDRDDKTRRCFFTRVPTGVQRSWNAGPSRPTVMYVEHPDMIRWLTASNSNSGPFPIVIQVQRMHGSRPSVFNMHALNDDK